MFDNHKDRRCGLYPQQGEKNAAGELPAAVALLVDVMMGFGGQYYTGWATIEGDRATFRPEVEGPDGNIFGVPGLTAQAPMVGIGTPTEFRLVGKEVSDLASFLATEEAAEQLLRN